MLKKINSNKISAAVLAISLFAFDPKVALTAEVASTVSPPPTDFNGNVGSGARKADGSIDFLEGFGKDIAGGSFDRAYNGLSGQIEIGEPLAEPDLNALNLSLAANLYGITETGKKFCKPIGADYPASVAHWYFLANDYLAAERLRDAIMKERMDTIKQKLAGLVSNKDKDQVQIDSVKYQIETLNAMIDSLSGSTLFSLDKRASESRATSRIAWREKLLVAVDEAAVKSQEEDTTLVKAAQACGHGSNVSVEAARAGCARMLKTGEKCDSEGKNCSDVIENVPVPGSCEVAGIYIPVIHKGVFVDIVELYSLTKIPSAELNKRYSRLVDQMTSTIASMPVSNDPKYDWTTPLNSCLDAAFGKHVRDFGMACTANHKAEDLKALNYDKLGSSNDPLIIAARETIGRVPNTVEYDIIKKEYAKLIAEGNSNDDALVKLKASLLQTPLGQLYLHGTPLSAEFSAKYEQDLQKHAQANSIVSKSCLEGAVCNTFPGPNVEEPDFGLATSATLSESTISFLEAIGIKGDDLAPAAEYFHKSWASDDLTLGHAKQRLTYFASVKPKIANFLTDDRKRLGIALLQRERLLQYHSDLINMYSNKDSSGKKSDVASAVNAKSSYSNLAGSNAKSAINIATSQGQASELNKPTQDLKIPILTASNQRLEVVETVAGNRLSATGKAALSGTGSINAYSISANDKLRKSSQLLTKLAGAKKNVIANSTFFDSAPEEKTTKVATVNSAVTPVLSASTMSKFQDTGIAEAVSSLPESSDSSSKKSSSSDLSGGNYNSYMQNFGFGGSPSPRPLMASLKSTSPSPIKPVKMSDARRGGGVERSSSSTGTEDQGKVTDAIWHLENSNIKDNYTSNADDSLFDILTKAHIRNYKKVQSIP